MHTLCPLKQASYTAQLLLKFEERRSINGTIRYGKLGGEALKTDDIPGDFFEENPSLYDGFRRGLNEQQFGANQLAARTVQRPLKGIDIGRWL